MLLLSAIVVLAGLLVLGTAETVELRGMKKIEFTADLDKGVNWGVQYQLVEGTIAFKVARNWGRPNLVCSSPARMGKYIMDRRKPMVHTRLLPRAVEFIRLNFLILIHMVLHPRRFPLVSSASLPNQVIISYDPADDITDKKLDPVQNELRELNAALRTVRDEHLFLMDREAKHRQGIGVFGNGFIYIVAISTNKRVMWWFVMQVAMLGTVCYWQISSLKSFFETRRLV